VASVARYIVLSRDADVSIVASWSAIGDELRYKLSEEDFKPAYQEMKKTVALIYLHPEEFTEENASEMILNNCRGDL